MGLEDELGVLEMAENIVGSNKILQHAETRARLLSLIPALGAAETQTMQG
jgi:hypothetical protein